MRLFQLSGVNKKIRIRVGDTLKHISVNIVHMAFAEFFKVLCKELTAIYF